jgi:hypothetical protein
MTQQPSDPPKPDPVPAPRPTADPDPKTSSGPNPTPDPETELTDHTMRIDEKRLRQRMLALLVKRVAANPLDEASAAGVEQKPGDFLVLPRRTPWLIELKGLAGTDRVGIAVVGEVVFGTGRVPDFDLTRYEAGDKGVSRRHAMLRPSKEHLYLIDLGSTNGTRINGDPVEAQKEITLKDNDLVSLGGLNFTVRIIATPAEVEAAQADAQEK